MGEVDSLRMTFQDPGADREPPRVWKAGVFRLGHEPREGLDESTTAEQRLALVWELTERMWSLTGKPFPSYPRAEIPCRVIQRG